MRYLEVVFNIPLSQSFYYANLDERISGWGKRVIAYLGKRKLTGFVIGESAQLPPDFPSAVTIKTIERFLDEESIFTESQLALAKKVACFYVCELGEVLSCMIPSAQRERSSEDLSSIEFSQQALKLSQEQCTAVTEISHAIQTATPLYFYLYGITGSGKTEVYLQAIQKALELGKSAIYLVPEISLTRQTTAALIERFGQAVAVLHSGLTASEKLQQWRRCMNADARIVVGARSAIFAPLKNLGLIVIDEEHDSSYKSSQTPRYHARQVAMMLSRQESCPLVMGSATPSLEAWYAAKSGTIKKLTLGKRLAGGEPPHIACVSMLGQSNALSKTLIAEMKAVKAKNKQSIIFLNRRGFTTSYVCYDCGYQLLCKNCSVPMTWHKQDGVMKCHYCGWQTAAPKKCPECGSLEAGYSGIGTEFIEDEIKRFLPECSVARLDSDTASKRGSVEKTLEDFRAHKLDILLGTQMVAKGLNFPDVSLVGIALADSGLQMPDFRASERCFALITQVAGRAGRFAADGKVIIQTIRPTHPAILYAKEAKLEDFYEYEIAQRRALGYPPFSRLLRIVFRSKSKEKAMMAAERFADILKKILPATAELLGPTECMISLIAGNYRYQILLKNRILPPMQKAVVTSLHTIKIAPTVYVEVDVDPMSLL